METIKKVVEIRDDFDGASFMYEDLKLNGELLFMESLDFEDLFNMNKSRCDNIEPLTEQQFYKVMFEYLKEHDKDYLNEYKETHEIEVMSNYDIKDFVWEHIYEGYILNEEEVFKHFAEVFDLNFGTVGYSPWSYYIALPDISGDFISDLYEGYNFYNITVYDVLNDNIIEEYDSVSGFYSNNDFKELERTILHNFDIEKDFKVIDNDDIRYMDVPKDRLVQLETEIIQRVKL